MSATDDAPGFAPSTDSESPIEQAVWFYLATDVGPPSHIHTNSPFWPHLLHASEVLRGKATVLPDPIWKPVANAFLSHLASRLDQAARQVLIFELAVHRQSDSDFAAETVTEFAAALRQSPYDLAQMLTAYPGLASLLLQMTDQVIAFCSEFTDALVTDWRSCSRQLQSSTEPVSLESLTRVSVLPSDPHAGGKTVVALGTTYPTETWVAVYKPRSVEVESRVTRLIRQISLLDDRLTGWRLPRYAGQGSRGWVEWIDQQDCTTEEQVRRYYFRAGVLLAVATALGITDLHRDNIIACGDSPVPVDLETVLQHGRRPEAPSRLGLRLPQVMEWNGLGTGLLPMWLWKGDDLQGLDLSGLGSFGDQWTSKNLTQFIQRDTPTERLVRDGIRLLPGRNVVRLAGRSIPGYLYISELQQGYLLGLELFGSVDPPAVIGALDSLPTRYIARPTAGYQYASQASLHPRFLRRAGLRESFLREALRDTSRVPDWMLEAEVRACLLCDIPRFASQPCDLMVDERTYGTPGALPTDEFVLGKDNAISYCASMRTPHRIEFELRLISGSMSSLRSADGLPPETTIRTHPRLNPEAWREHAPVAAGSALDFIERLAIESRDTTRWYGFRSSPNGQYEFGLLGDHFYSGTTGILFAMAASRLSRESTLVVDALHRSVETVEKRLADQREKLGGAYFGSLSCVLPLAYALQEYGLHGIRSDLLDHALCALEQKLEAPAPERFFWGVDFLSGIAGAITVSASSWHLTGHPGWLKCGVRLWQLMRDAGRSDDKDTLVWAQPTISLGPKGALCGLSHGQAGCALGLGELAAVEVLPTTTRSELARDSRRAAVWELQQFSPERANFPDYRRRARDAAQGEFGWSHGAPGTYCALMRLVRLIEAPEIGSFLEAHPFEEAIGKYTRTAPAPLNNSLCHGALGTFLLAWTLLGGSRNELQAESMKELADWARLSHWALFETQPLRQDAVDPPGCMVGRAGSLLGWCALESGDASKVPFLPCAFIKDMALPQV